jgi:hypothetical protein
MSAFDQIKKDLDNSVIPLFHKFSGRDAVLIGAGGDGITWSDFRHLYLVYSQYPPEFETTEPFFDRFVLSFTHHELSVPVLGLVEAEPAVRGPDTVDDLIIRPIKAMYAGFTRAFLNSTQTTADEVPLRLKLQWTRRIAVQFPWEGRVLALKARGSALQELLDVPGARFTKLGINARDVANCLTDDFDAAKLSETIDTLLDGKPGEWWFETYLPDSAAEELRKTWKSRYKSLSWLRNRVASWTSSGTFVLTVFLAVYMQQFRTVQQAPRFGRHLRVALDAHRKDPRAELLLNLGRSAHKLGMHRTAWHLLLLSARSLPYGSHNHFVRYHYTPWLLSALADLAKRAGFLELANQYNTWFEERVLAEGIGAPELPSMLSELGISSD